MRPLTCYAIKRPVTVGAHVGHVFRARGGGPFVFVPETLIRENDPEDYYLSGWDSLNRIANGYAPDAPICIEPHYRPGSVDLNVLGVLEFLARLERVINRHHKP